MQPSTPLWSIAMTDAQDDDDCDDDEGPPTCPHCSGTGGNPWDDGITPCEYCDGEGYEWWL